MLSPAAREAEVIRALSGQRSLRPHLPHLPHLPRSRDEDSLDLAAYHAQPGLRRPPVSVAADLGRALASLHRLPSDLLPPARHCPAVQDFPCPASTAALDLIRTVQGTTGFGERLAALAATWSTVAPTHQDVSGGKILLRGKRPRVALIGWELAGPGDPRWDIGCALAHYLSLWISSVPDSSLTATRPLETVQPAMRACWHAYATAMGMKGDAPQRFLETTLPFAALRLVRAAVESAQGSPRPTAAQVLHLQVAHNILERPREAAKSMLSAGSGHRRAG